MDNKKTYGAREIKKCRINSATHEIESIDNETKDEIPIIGQKCYEAFWGRKAPCSFCPLDYYDDNSCPAQAFGWLKYDAEKDDVVNVKIEPDGNGAKGSFVFSSHPLNIFKDDNGIMLKKEADIANLIGLMRKHSDDNIMIIDAILSLMKETYEADECFAVIRKLGVKAIFCRAGSSGVAEARKTKAFISFGMHILNSLKSVSGRVLLKPDETSDILKRTAGSEPKSKYLLKSSIFADVLDFSVMKDLNGAIIISNPKQMPENDSYMILMSDMLRFNYLETVKDTVSSYDPFYDVLSKVNSANSFLIYEHQLLLTPPQSLGVVFIDLNGLKFANDNYGHDLGDTMIISTAETILKVFPRDQVFRIGGDEFVIIAEDMNQNDFVEQTQRLRRQFFLDKTSSVSIGIAYGEKSKADINSLIHEADKEMYLEKATFYDIAQKNSTVFSTICNSTLESTMDNIISSGNLTVDYVPRFSMPDRNVVEADAIIRVLKPINCISNPFFFVEIAEKIGLAAKLNAYVFRLISAMLGERLKNGKPVVPIAINLSRSAIINPDTIKELAGISDEYHVPHECYDLQLIHIGRDISANLVSFAAGAKANGFRISLNHFGVGNSNLTVLPVADFDKVKIDRSFVDSVRTERGFVILRQLVNCLNKLNTRVCCDGIDTKEQLDAVKSIGFSCFRGKYLSGSLTKSAFEKLLDKSHK